MCCMYFISISNELMNICRIGGILKKDLIADLLDRKSVV